MAARGRKTRRGEEREEALMTEAPGESFPAHEVLLENANRRGAYRRSPARPQRQVQTKNRGRRGTLLW